MNRILKMVCLFFIILKVFFSLLMMKLRKGYVNGDQEFGSMAKSGGGLALQCSFSPLTFAIAYTLCYSHEHDRRQASVLCP